MSCAQEALEKGSLGAEARRPVRSRRGGLQLKPGGCGWSPSCPWHAQEGRWGRPSSVPSHGAERSRRDPTCPGAQELQHKTRRPTQQVCPVCPLGAAGDTGGQSPTVTAPEAGA